MKKVIKRRPSDLESSQFSAAIPPLLQRIYAARHIGSDKQLSTQLSDVLTPDSLKGVAQAVELIADTLQAGQRILVVGDFDADGATSSALAVLALREMGAANVDFLVPNRFEFGYGLTPEIVDVASQWSPALIITVDNGISSIDGVQAAKQAGINVLITDHHLPGAHLPDADAIVNPNQPGCTFASKSLAGVGVIFYVMSALRAQLRREGWFDKQGIGEPNMADYLDLVALGTVADVVPLDQNNRILVEQGLRRIRSGRCRHGIKALLSVANRTLHRVISSDLGFAVGPRLNAAGRLDDMSLGIQCLMAESDNLAMQIAIQLDGLNRDRKFIEAGMQREAMIAMDQLSLHNDALPVGICLYDGNWHQGVIGILASRLKDRYHRPVITFADATPGDSTDDAMIKGSARSIPGLHIRDALDAVAAQHPQILKKFGGHAMAAGMSLRKKDFQCFSSAFNQHVTHLLDDEDLQPVVLSDGGLELGDFTLDLAQCLRSAGPWGQHFPEPLFDGVFYLLQQRIVGEKHLKLVVALDANGQHLIDAIVFNIDAEFWPNESVKKAQLAYKLDVNEFRGRESLQLLVDYIEPVE